jgi:phosphoglycolate phosphatase-like HAD superfamily hydrolase
MSHCQPVRLVLFDIDGTLIQSGGAGEKAFAWVGEAEFGISNGTTGLFFAGRTDPAIVRDFFVQHGIPTTSANFQRFFARYVFYLDHLLGQLDGCVLPRVEEWLAGLGALPQRPLVGLLTGNILLGARLKLGHYGLWDHFRLGAFGDDHENRNELAAIALERGRGWLGKALAGSEVLVIGDTPKDIECARAIGARCLAVATGRYSVAELEREDPNWAVEDLSKLSPHEACG